MRLDAIGQSCRELPENHGIVFPGGRTEWVFGANTRLPGKKRIALPAPETPTDMAVGVWQGPDLTSAERQVLGVVRIPASLLTGGPPYALDFIIGEGMALKVELIAQNQRFPLALDPPHRA